MHTFDMKIEPTKFRKLNVTHNMKPIHDIDNTMEIVNRNIFAEGAHTPSCDKQVRFLSGNGVYKVKKNFYTRIKEKYNAVIFVS